MTLAFYALMGWLALIGIAAIAHERSPAAPFLDWLAKRVAGKEWTERVAHGLADHRERHP